MNAISRSLLKRRPLVSRAGVFLTVLALSLLWFGQSGPAPVSADHIPQRPDEISYRMNFETTRPDMFGPGGLAPVPRQTNLLNFSWNEDESVDGTVEFGGSFPFFGSEIDLPTATFGADITAQTDGSLNVGAGMEGFNAGTLSVKYPVEITLQVPKRDTFRRGDTITIGSTARLLGDAELTTSPPTQGSVSAGANLQAGADLGLDLCIGDCVSSLSFTPPAIDLGSIDVPIPCGTGSTLNVSVPLPSLNLFAVGQFGLQASLGIDEGGNFFRVVDLTDQVKIGPKHVATRLVDAVAKARAEEKSLSQVIGDDPVLGTYASMLPGGASDQLAVLTALLALTQEVEDCVSAEAARQNKIGVVTTLLKNFTTFACCSGFVSLPQVETESVQSGTSLVASGEHEFVDITVDPVTFFDPVKRFSLPALATRAGLKPGR